MKINREAAQFARKVFRACLTEKGLDEEKLSTLLKAMQKNQPRNHYAILTRLKKLVTLHNEAITVLVETATELKDDSELKKAFGAEAKIEVTVKPELLGGMRIRQGSNVWDSTVSGRLEQLASQF